MIRLRAVLLVCGALAAAPAFGASPDPKDLTIPPQELSKARALVRQLGSEIYREREDAQAELVKMGRIAKQALTEGATSDGDPEVRLRAARLLPKASADDLKARIDTFLADTEGKFEHDLPGLKTFRKNVGADAKARDLYVEILKTPYNLDMFAAMDKSETEGGRAVSDRRNALWNDMQHRPFPGGGGKPFVPKQPSLPDIAAVLFAESMVSADSIPKTGTWTWVNGTQFLGQPASHDALSNARPHSEAYKVIVRKWLITRTDPQELGNLVYQLGNTTLKQLPETMTLLRRIITTEGVAGYAKGQALMHIVQQQKPKEETAFLKSLLTNDTMVQQVWFGRPNGQAEMHSCLMRDVALAYLVTQDGGNIRDYGFEVPPGVIVQPGQLGYGNYAFTSEEKRTAAFMKYGWSQVKGATKPEPAPKDGPKPAPKNNDPKPAPTPPAIDLPAPPLPVKPIK